MSQQETPIHQVKVIDFFDRKVPIVLQNVNGPCPLLSLVNVLSLRNKINSAYLNPQTNYIPQERLQQLVAEILLDSNQFQRNPEFQANQEQNISDAIASLPKLATGLDVNPRFTSTNGFEFTNEITIFDLLDITLVHGWLVDPDEVEFSQVVGDKSFNEVSDFIVLHIGDAGAAKETVMQVLSPTTSARLTTSEQGSFTVQDPDLQKAIQMSLEGELADYEVVDQTSVDEDSKVVKLVQSVDSFGQIANQSGNLIELSIKTDQDESDMVTVELQTCSNGEPQDNSSTDVQDKSDSDVQNTHNGNQEKALVMLRFLSQHQSQLTMYGIYQILKTLKDNELAVFFRNNHFSTIFKHKDSLYLLVTDQGFQGEANVVWEKLDNAINDTQFFSSKFALYSQQQLQDKATKAARLLAESYQQGQVYNQPYQSGDGNLTTTTQPQPNEQSYTVVQLPQEHNYGESSDADFALALQLQQEEQLRQQQHKQQLRNVGVRGQQIQQQVVQQPQQYQEQQQLRQQGGGRPSVWRLPSGRQRQQQGREQQSERKGICRIM